jgi:hypothetical protein
MLVREGPPLSKPRKMYRFTGMGTHIRYGVHDHSLGNVRRGLVERVYMVEKDGNLVYTPLPTPKVFNQLSRFQLLLNTHLTKTTRMTYKQFLAFYSGRKLERYTKAVESLEVLPVREKDAWLSTFVKAEKLNLSAKPDPAPRVIQPRDPRYNVEVGRYLRHAEEYLFHAIDKVYGGRTIFKGISADTAGIEFKSMWDSFKDPVAIGMDASRFDQHVSADCLKFEHKMWLSMFPQTQRKQLHRLLSWQISNKGLARCPDGEIKYRVEGCRMSGDMNTSSGNCYIMCATVHNWCHEVKHMRHFRLANNGDDCVVVMERCDEPKFRDGLVDYYTSLGFTMKVEPTVDELEQIEFCQTHPILVGDAYRMVRNLHHSMSKDLHSLHDLQSDKAAREWIGAVGCGGRVLNDGVPVLSHFYQQFPSNGSSRTKSDMSAKLEEEWQYKFSRTGKFQGLAPTPQSRYSFWRAFGVLPDEQIALEIGFRPLSLDRVEEAADEQTSLLQFSKA